MENLAVDITTAIVSHLPAKILMKFRSVSKSWRDMIDSSFFRNLHVENQVSLNRNVNEDDTVLLQSMPRADRHLSGKLLKIMILDFPSYKDFLRNNDMTYTSLRFSGQAHGLICMYKTCSTNPIGLCNPLLKEIKILPKSECTPSYTGINGRHVGIGYDHVEKDFKVVQLWSDVRRQRTIAEVYSRKENKWRELEGDHPLHKLVSIQRPVLSSSCRGAFAHWYAVDLSLSNRAERDMIVSFDMCNEAIRTIVIPPFEEDNFEADNFYRHFLAKEDSLFLFICSADKILSMWEHKLRLLSSGNNNWIKRGSFGPFNVTVWPLMWWKTDELLLNFYCSNTRSFKIAQYDCCTGQIVASCNDTDEPHLKLVPYNSPTFISP